MSFCLRCGRCMSAIHSDRHGCDKHRTYTRRQLLSLHAAATPPSAGVQHRIRSLGLWAVCRLRRGRVYRYRGCRAGRSHRPLPLTRSVNNGAHVIVGNRPHPPARERRPTSVIRFTSTDILRPSASGWSSAVTTFALWLISWMTCSKFVAICLSM